MHTCSGWDEDCQGARRSHNTKHFTGRHPWTTIPRSDTGKDARLRVRQQVIPPNVDICKKVVMRVVCTLICSENPRKKKKRMNKYLNKHMSCWLMFCFRCYSSSHWYFPRPVSRAVIGFRSSLLSLPVKTNFTLQDLDSQTGPDISPARYLSGVCNASVHLSDRVFDFTRYVLNSHIASADLPLIRDFCLWSPKTVGEWKIRAKMVQCKTSITEQTHWHKTLIISVHPKCRHASN